MLRIVTCGLALAALIVATAHASAAAPPPAPEPLTHANPAYPGEALERELEGDVTLYVTIAGGRLIDAAVAEETPAGFGFADATLAAVRQWTWGPQTSGRFLLRIRYRLQSGEEGGEGGSGMTDGPHGPLPRAPIALREGGLRYPAAALARNLGGTVYLVVTIADDGTVSDIEVEYERPEGYEFGVNARKAVRKWRYPAGMAGVYRQIIHFGTCDPADCPEPPPRGTSAKIYPAPDPVSRAEPDYPSAAKAKGIAGSADLIIELTAEGDVVRADIAVETPPGYGYGFGFAAVHAVKEWKFPAGTQPGSYTITVRFNPD